MDHYAEAFTLMPGRCWRMVEALDGTTHPAHCAGGVHWRGTYVTEEGKTFKVHSCEDHADGLTSARWARAAGH